MLDNMKLHTPYPYRPGRESFQFRDREEGETVEISLSFSEGGVNYANYKQEAKGLYVHITPMVVEKSNGMICRKISLFGNITTSGAKILVLPLARRNSKKMETVAALLDPHVSQICALFRENPASAFAKVRELLPVETVAA